MIQIAYISSTRGLFTERQLTHLLLRSREKNRSRGITGMLLYKDGSVLQIIEGEESSVVSLVQSIQKDPRLTGFLQLYRKQIEARDFPEWSMGFQNMDASSVQPEGFSNFFDRNFDMLTIKPSAASKLLGSFKRGIR